jgi:hypothetical protein
MAIVCPSEGVYSCRVALHDNFIDNDILVYFDKFLRLSAAILIGSSLRDLVRNDKAQVAEGNRRFGGTLSFWIVVVEDFRVIVLLNPSAMR